MLSSRKTLKGHRLKAEASSIARCDWVEGSGRSESMQSGHLHNYLQQEAWCALTSVFFLTIKTFLKIPLIAICRRLLSIQNSPDANEPPYALPELSAHSLTPTKGSWHSRDEEREVSDCQGRDRSLGGIQKALPVSVGEGEITVWSFWVQEDRTEGNG